MSTYIAGPMTGHPDWNYPAFHEAAAQLRGIGYDVVNPAEMHEPRQVLHSWEWYMRRSLHAMLGCDELVLLPGWEGSRGARLERQVATELGMKVTPWGRGVTIAGRQDGGRPRRSVGLSPRGEDQTSSEVDA